jgi:hypothetical protein
VADEKNDVISRATKQFQIAAEAEGPWRKEALTDIKFHAGTHGDASYQWPESYQTARATDGRPCLTINRLPSFTKQVTNQERLADRTVQYNPVDAGADEKTAEALTGVVRHIQQAGFGDVEVARDTAFANAVVCGKGFYRFRTDYVAPDSWQQEILCDWVRNPLSVYTDPMAKRPDKRDMGFGFIVEDMEKDAYDELYPDSAVASMSGFQSIGDEVRNQWFPNGAVRIAEYYEAVRTRTKKRSPEGKMVWRTDTKIIWRLINGVEVLEEREVPGSRVPILPIIGDELDIDGHLDFRGMIRDARDPQRMYNFWMTALTEQIALGSKAPWILPFKSVEGFEALWRNANRANYAFLPYHHVNPGGNHEALPAPFRDTAEPPIQAMVQALGLSDNALKSVMQLYDASLGQRGPEQSGRAILARKEQGEIGNANYSDNFKRALVSEGQLYLDWIPYVYEKATVLRILGKDGRAQRIILHDDDQQAAEALAQQHGIDQIYDPTLGRYDVTVSVGPSFVSKRQEAVASMLDLAKADPQIVPVIGDLLVKNMDWPGASEISERLKKLLPPQLQEPKDGQQVDPQQLQQQLQQMGEQHAQLVQALNEATQKLHSKQQELDAQMAIAQENNRSKEHIAELTQLTNRMVAADKLSVQENVTALQAKIDLVMAQIEHMHNLELGEQEHQHALIQGDQAHQQQLEQGQQAAALQPPIPEPGAEV